MVLAADPSDLSVYPAKQVLEVDAVVETQAVAAAVLALRTVPVKQYMQLLAKEAAAVAAPPEVLSVKPVAQATLLDEPGVKQAPVANLGTLLHF